MPNINSHIVLYVHGLDSSKESPTYYMIKDYFEPLGFKVIAETFNYYRRPATILKQIETIITDNKVDMVIGSSLGGFYVLNIKPDVYKVVINPCMYPSVELMKRNPRCKFIFDAFVNYEQLYTPQDNVFGIFGTNDELFSYIDSYKALYRDSFIEVEGMHRLNKESLQEGLNAAMGHFKIDTIYSKVI